MFSKRWQAMNGDGKALKKTISKQWQSNTKTIPEQYENNFKAFESDEIIV
jgi:hypothetical protein